MAAARALLVAYITLVSVVCAQCGQDKVFSLPITNVTLSNGAAVRGIPISVGTPPQTLAFAPQWPLNDTWIYDQQGQCPGDLTTKACITRRGGLYNQQSSTSSASSGPEVQTDNATITSGKWLTDNIGLTQSVQLQKFPFGVPRQAIGGDYETMNVLGLNTNSSILSTLLQQGNIASRTWSMWWGKDGATAPATQDGIFVFGGFDLSKVSGPNYTAQLNPTPACATGMLVNVNDITLSFPNGTEGNLVSPDQGGFAACIDPTWSMALDIDNDLFENFESITGTMDEARSFGTNFYGLLYDSDDVFEGDMIVKLSNGLQTTIRNSQLLLPDRTINAQSGALIANTTYTELLINRLQQVNADDMPKLGRPFLSSTYLMVNLDANTFTLWTTAQNAPAQPNLQPIGATCPPPAAAGNGPNTSPSPSASAAPTAQQSSGISGGAIAGIVVGVIAGIAIVGAAAAFFLMKRRKQAHMEAAAAPAAAQAQAHVDYKAIPTEPQEVDGRQVPSSRGPVEKPPEYYAPQHQVPGLHEMPSAHGS